MPHPDAVIKHDGRRVPFDLARLIASICGAAGEARVALSGDAVVQLAREAAESVSRSAVDQGKSALPTSDMRVMAMQALRDLHFESVAEAYQNHARLAALALWRVRVIEAGMPREEASGTPWDRRRLRESLIESGVAFDPAGAAARSVERSLVTLRPGFVSTALIHALAVLALPPDAYGAQAYAARRVSYSAVPNYPHWSAQTALEYPLPPGGAALEEFWLQTLHSPAVVQAVRDNLLSLDPYPAGAAAPNEADIKGAGIPADPLAGHEFSTALERCCSGELPGFTVSADSVERIGALAESLARISITCSVPVDGGAGIILVFKTPPRTVSPAVACATPVTVNAGGLVAREALRDPRRAAARLGAIAGLAAQAHREREEYFLRSPVHGRVLPIAVAGLWNATAWIQGANFDATRAPIGARQVIAPLCQALRDSVESLRRDSGMELLLTAAAPLSAERRLWRGDRGFFLQDLRDGSELNKASAYECGPELKLSAGTHDFTDRLDFARTIGEAFDESPELTIAVPPGESDPAQWKELLGSLAKVGIARLRMTFAGGARTVPNWTRAIRSYLVGFPLLDPLDT